VEAALGWDRRVVAVRVDELAETDDVVADDQAAGAGMVEGPGEILGRVGLVGVDEGQVEGAGALRVELGKLVEGWADAQVDEVADPGTVDVPARDLGIAGLRLQGDQATAGPGRALASQIVL
jgi:hypothetical protein